MIVDNYEDWVIRNSRIEKIIDEKRKEIEKLKLEIFTLNFTLDYWKKNRISKEVN